jgi:excisionase family DNA binding protein
MDKEWYTIEELAKMWELKVSTVRAYVRTGQLEAVRFGNTYRIHKDAVEKFIDQRKTRKEGE